MWVRRMSKPTEVFWESVPKSWSIVGTRQRRPIGLLVTSTSLGMTCIKSTLSVHFLNCFRELDKRLVLK